MDEAQSGATGQSGELDGPLDARLVQLPAEVKAGPEASLARVHPQQARATSRIAFSGQAVTHLPRAWQASARGVYAVWRP